MEQATAAGVSQGGITSCGRDSRPGGRLALLLDDCKRAQVALVQGGHWLSGSTPETEPNPGEALPASSPGVLAVRVIKGREAAHCPGQSLERQMKPWPDCLASWGLS